jgi:hypothetical protein
MVDCLLVNIKRTTKINPLSKSRTFNLMYQGYMGYYKVTVTRTSLFYRKTSTSTCTAVRGQKIVHTCVLRVLYTLYSTVDMEQTIVVVALAGVKKAQAVVDRLNESLEEWKKTNPNYTTKEARFIEVNERLDKANERLDEANEYFLQIVRTSPTIQIQSEPRRVDNTLSQEAKRPRVESREALLNKPAQEQITSLLEKISDFDERLVFVLGNFTTVPFPSTSKEPDRFQLSDERFFQYQNRSELQSLYNDVKGRGNRQCSDTINVVGTIGYGKSHMLAVLALLLLKNRMSLGVLRNGEVLHPTILYIPDCRIVKDEYKFLGMMQENILINFPDYVGPLKTVNDINQLLYYKSVILIADQYNSIDDKNDDCMNAKKTLFNHLGASVAVEIRVISMNSWQATQEKQTIDANITYCGGFSDKEFDVWMLRHQSNTLFMENEDELILLTGKTPLLLSSYEKYYKEGISWQSLSQKVLQDKQVLDLQMCLKKFYHKTDPVHVREIYLHLAYPNQMPDVDEIDHRFFYKNKNGLFCSIGDIVTRMLFQVWKSKVSNDEILGVWKLRSKLPPNQSSRRFLVEEIVKAKICQDGVSDKYHRDPHCIIRRHLFTYGEEGAALRSACTALTTDSWILLDPQNFNYAGVGMIFVTCKSVDKALVKEIVGINVTIATKHSPMTSFFEIWKPLAHSMDMSVQGLFIAPDGFTNNDETIKIVYLKNFYYDLWLAIKNDPLPDVEYACGCKTKCTTRRDNKLCRPNCSCQNKLIEICCS